MSKHTAPSFWGRMFHRGSHNEKLKLEAIVTAEPPGKITSQQELDSLRTYITEIDEGIDYGKNRIAAESIIHRSASARKLYGTALEKAIAKGEKVETYKQYKAEVLGGNTAVADSYKAAAKAIGIPEAEVKETLGIGANIEGAGYFECIFLGNIEYLPRLENLVRFGFPKEYVETARAECERIKPGSAKR